jgi:hypothetical protein
MSDEKLTEREIARQLENIKRDADKAAALVSKVRMNAIALVYNSGGLVRSRTTGEVYHFVGVRWRSNKMYAEGVRTADSIEVRHIREGIGPWDDMEILLSDTPLPPKQQELLWMAHNSALWDHPEWCAARDKAHAEIEARVEAGEKLTNEDQTRIVDEATTAAEDKIFAGRRRKKISAEKVTPNTTPKRS